jgi:hypothetical protein
MMRVFCVVWASRATTRPSVDAPDDAAGGGAPAEGGDVADDVARSARSQLLARHVHDRHRCLRRDALHPPPHELIEHEVADDEHADAREPAQEGGEAPRRHTHGRSS